MPARSTADGAISTLRWEQIGFWKQGAGPLASRRLQLLAHGRAEHDVLTKGENRVPRGKGKIGQSDVSGDAEAAITSRQVPKNGFLPFVPDDSVLGIYGVVLVINVWLFVIWQKRKVAEPVTAVEGAPTEPTSGGSPLARMRARREARTSAFGRPVTTTE